VKLPEGYKRDLDLTFQPGGMSPEHIEKHLFEFTKKSQVAGYHGGLSANAHIALLREPISNVMFVLNKLYRTEGGKLVNPFGCAGTHCMIWYFKGISKDWSAYGGKGFQTLRNGEVCMTYEEALLDAYRLAVAYPERASSGGNMTADEVERVRTRLSLVTAKDRQTDANCVFCPKSEKVGIVPTPTANPDEFLDDDPEPDDHEYDDDEEDN